MDWAALLLSLQLAFWTCALLLPLAVSLGRWLAWSRLPGKGFVAAIIALPLVLPPTVLGYYLLMAVGGDSMLGKLYQGMVGHELVFTFDGLLLASLIFNLPFAVLPLHRAFEAIPGELREAAWCAGMSRLATFWRIELPLARPGLVSAVALTSAHTLGEFGVVLMMGGNIPGETRTISLAIYDRVQAFDETAAGAMSAVLLGFSLMAIGLVYRFGDRAGR
jgi:molybdate transport system permease protein